MEKSKGIGKYVAIIILFYSISISAIPLGTCEKAKACKHRE